MYLSVLHKMVFPFKCFFIEIFFPRAHVFCCRVYVGEAYSMLERYTIWWIGIQYDEEVYCMLERYTVCWRGIQYVGEVYSTLERFTVC